MDHTTATGLTGIQEEWWRACREELRALATLPIEEIPAVPPGWAERLLRTLENRFAKVRLLRFQTVGKVPLADNPLWVDALLPALLGRAEVQRALLGADHAVETVELPHAITHIPDRYELVGKLSSVAATGGAYRTKDGLAGENLLKAAFNFSNYLTTQEEQHYSVWYYQGAWCSWFRGMAWDHTLLIVDRTRTHRFTLLLTTCED